NEIIGDIFQYIEREKKQVGDRLPSERELAKILNVNRATLREALKTLNALRVIEIKHGSGVFLRNFYTESSFEALVFKLFSVSGLNKKEYMDVLEVRNIIEPPIASLAAERASQEEIKSIQNIINVSKEKLRENLNIYNEDKFFHEAIAIASKNFAIVKIINSIEILLSSKRQSFLSDKTRALKSHEQHEKIFNAIKAGDKKLARKCMEEHLLDVQEALKNLLKD
ncbi:MAG: FadR family transcriptional regulator, partial [Actinobacteria bacterium]|nr:FadR family transcriptional regulator [Actinomycetota bacterium]